MILNQVLGLSASGPLRLSDIGSDLFVPAFVCAAIALFVGAGAPGTKWFACQVGRVAPQWLQYGVYLFLLSVLSSEGGGRFIYGNPSRMIAMSAHFSPNRWGLTFHHLGLAVKDPQVAEHFFDGPGLSDRPDDLRSAAKCVSGNVHSQPNARRGDHLSGRGQRSTRQVTVGS